VPIVAVSTGKWTLVAAEESELWIVRGKAVLVGTPLAFGLGTISATALDSSGAAQTIEHFNMRPGPGRTVRRTCRLRFCFVTALHRPSSLFLLKHLQIPFGNVNLFSIYITRCFLFF